MKKIVFVLAAIILVAASVGTAALTGSQLYSRHAHASIIADTSNAYIQFKPLMPEGVHVTTDAKGRVKFDFGASGNGGMGVNPDSFNVFHWMFMLQNNGTQPLKVWYSTNNPRCAVFWDHNQYWTDGIDGIVGTTKASAITISPGSGGQWTLGLIIDATGKSAGSNINCALQFNAEVP